MTAMTEGQRVWEAWLAAYNRIRDAAPKSVEVTCPSCGRGRVHVSWTGDPVTRIGYAVVWCDACEKGIYLSRVGVPDGVEMFTFDTPEEVRDAAVPDVELIPPDPFVDESDPADA
ncbi:hypothetical protein [Micromonospora sp. NPDC049282]|uniref:hypothetical protein n=1 Tax=Micromonospora sp. NPDC049282 TaxID=3364269 RepID=UPI003722EB85